MRLLINYLLRKFNVRRPYQIGDRVQHPLTGLKGTVVGFQKYTTFPRSFLGRLVSVRLDDGKFIPSLDSREFVLDNSRTQFIDPMGSLYANRRAL